MDPSTTTEEAIALEPINPQDSSNPHNHFKQFTVNKASLKNLSLCPAGSDTPLLYVANYFWTPGKHDICLHTGDSKAGPVLGVAHLDILGRNNTIGLGDPNSALTSMVWEKLSRVSKVALSKYTFDSIFGEEGRKTFEWRSTKHIPFDDQGDFELVEVENPHMALAKFVGVGLVKHTKRGTLLIREGYGDAWELMVLLTWLGIVELSRRRARVVRNTPI